MQPRVPHIAPTHTGSGRLPYAAATAAQPRTGVDAIRDALVAFFGARADQLDAAGVVDVPQALLDELLPLHDLEDQALALVMGRYPAAAAA